MNRDVKASRPYQGAARQARTRRTRAAVVEAARSLFVERGYAATTIEAISDRSDTPQATVYRLFSSKLGILKAVLDVSVGGDDAGGGHGGPPAGSCPPGRARTRRTS